MNNRKCPSCQYGISLSWFLFSFKWTKYRCTRCGALIGWTSRRTSVAMFAGAFSGAFIPLAEQIIPSFFWRVVIVLAVALVLDFSVPNQYELIEEKDI